MQHTLNIEENSDSFELINNISKSRLRRLKNKYIPLFLEFSSDFIAITLSFFLQFYIRFETGLINNGINPNFVHDPTLIIYPLLFMLIYWIGLYFVSGLYVNWYEQSPFNEFFALIKVNLFGSFVFAFILFSGTSGSPRLLFLIHFLILTLFVIIFRFIARRVQQRLRRNGIIQFNVILVGEESLADNIALKLAKNKHWGFNLIGFVNLESDINDKQKDGKFQNNSHLSEIIDRYEPDSILLACNQSMPIKLMEIANLCAEKDIRCKIEPDLYHIFTGQTKTISMYGIPFIEISPQLLKYREEIAKRVFDIIFSALVLIIGLPVWILTALLVKLSSKGAIFYSQDRTGKDGKIFRIYKFRSMVSNADKMGVWTSTNDSRVTPIGKFLRKSHLDEIPQFWNVLIGEMSIVGPRPEQPRLVKEFSEQIPYYSRRLKVRPGITGWWQVKYTSYELSLEEIENRLKDDFYYIEKMSLRFDIEIVIRTVWCVIKGHGQA